MIAGLQHPTSGRITVLPRRAGMAFVEPRLLPGVTVLENLFFIAPKARHRAMQLLAALRMDGLRDSLADSLSKGQAQRVALVRALLGHPEILLLGEALCGLDLPPWWLARDLVAESRLRDSFALVEISHDPARLTGSAAQEVALA